MFSALPSNAIQPGAPKGQNPERWKTARPSPINRPRKQTNRTPNHRKMLNPDMDSPFFEFGDNIFDCVRAAIPADVGLPWPKATVSGLNILFCRSLGVLSITLGYRFYCKGVTPIAVVRIIARGG